MVLVPELPLLLVLPLLQVVTQLYLVLVSLHVLPDVKPVLVRPQPPVPQP